jgi:hypothetical protein
MPEASTLNDQIRGMAMALRHWFEVTETEELMVQAGLRGAKGQGLFSRKEQDRRLQVLTVTALPPQVVRLKSDAPMTTLHLLQDVYDDGELRADPWRWWFAWISIEMIARLGPDATGVRVRDFIKSNESLGPIRANAARWLASNPTRMTVLEREFATLVDRVATDSGAEGKSMTIENVLRHPALTIIEAMSSEAGRLAASITARLADRAK